MKLYLIAGEVSGDLHGANMLRELRQMRLGLQVRGMGGDRLQAEGMDLFIHCREMNFMGFVEVARHLRRILGNMRRVKEDILAFRPDAVVLIDYPGFNLRMAEFCKKQGIRVIYYISPQIWAWKTSRVKKIRAYTDAMISILPFEQEFYARYDVHVHYVGHPLLDALNNDSGQRALPAELPPDERPLVALLPGSRKMEIENMLPVMLEVARKYAGQYRFVVAGAPSMEPEYYRQFMTGQPVQIVYHQTYALLANAHAALVTSGTATLETALFRVPQVVCYKAKEISYQIARRLAKVNYISLPNLILDRPALTELIQHDLRVERLEQEFLAIVGGKRQQILQDYDELIGKLGRSGASRRAAEVVHQVLTA